MSHKILIKALANALDIRRHDECKHFEHPYIDDKELARQFASWLVNKFMQEEGIDYGE